MTDNERIANALLLVLQGLADNVALADRLLLHARGTISMNAEELAAAERQLADARRNLPILTAHAHALRAKIDVH